MDAACLWWLCRKMGWSDELAEMARRLRCERCHANGGSVVRPRWTVTREMPEGPQPPPPDKYEWRRLVSRYRA